MAVEVKEVPGLYLMENVISKADQKHILKSLLTNNGNVCYQVHQAREFGWAFLKGLYNRQCVADNYIQIPIWAKNIWAKIIEKTNLKDLIGKLENIETVDNILINTYGLNDALIPHVDDVNFWNGCDIVMDFTKINSNETHSVKIPGLSVYVLTGDARYLYKHGIKKQKFNGLKRVSVTFRTITARYLPGETRQLISKELL